jgi:hypothetical protein
MTPECPSMPPNPVTASNLADMLIVMKPDAADRALRLVAAQLTAFAIREGCCRLCALDFTANFVELVGARMRDLTSHPTMH